MYFIMGKHVPIFISFLCDRRDFLPRGSGIVTRRPLVLQLYCTAAMADTEEGEALMHEGMPEDAEWGEFLHRPGHKFFNFDVSDSSSPTVRFLRCITHSFLHE